MSDENFDAAIVKVNAKLKEAAEALAEAARLGKEAGLPALIPAMWISEDFFCSKVNRGRDRDELDTEWEAITEKFDKVDVSAFESALGSAGWSASASYC